MTMYSTGDQLSRMVQLARESRSDIDVDEDRETNALDIVRGVLAPQHSAPHFPQCHLDDTHDGDCYDANGNRLYFAGLSAWEARARFHHGGAS